MSTKSPQLTHVQSWYSNIKKPILEFGGFISSRLDCTVLSAGLFFISLIIGCVIVQDN